MCSVKNTAKILKNKISWITVLPYGISPLLKLWLIFLHFFFLKRDANVGLDDGEWDHICFTWRGRNGDYEFYKDGVSVGRGTGMNVGGKIRSVGTTVIGQDQDEVGGVFVASQAFVGDVTEVNVWGAALSESDIVAKASNCHITQGSVNWWSQFKFGVHGGVDIVE